jgi:hypothetical protein
MAEPTHRERAESLLADALAYPVTSPTRAVILAEAGVHAALSALPVDHTPRTARKPAPPKGPDA